MLLTLSSENVRSATFTSASGQPLYVSSTPSHFMWTTTFIKKYVSDDFQLEMKDRFEVAAKIKWRMLFPSKFRVGGKSLKPDSFLTKSGFTGRYALCSIKVNFLAVLKKDVVEGEHSRHPTVGGIGGTCIVASWW